MCMTAERREGRQPLSLHRRITCGHYNMSLPGVQVCAYNIHTKITFVPGEYPEKTAVFPQKTCEKSAAVL